MPRETHSSHRLQNRRWLPPGRRHRPDTPEGIDLEALKCDAFVFDSSDRPVAAVVGEPARTTWDVVLSFDGWLQARQLPAATRELLGLSQADLIDIAAEAEWGSVEVCAWCRERWPDMGGWEGIGRVLPRFPAATEWRLVVRAVVW